MGRFTDLFSQTEQPIVVEPTHSVEEVYEDTQIVSVQETIVDAEPLKTNLRTVSTSSKKIKK
jgi:hypothetical protein